MRASLEMCFGFQQCYKYYSFVVVLIIDRYLYVASSCYLVYVLNFIRYACTIIISKSHNVCNVYILDII